MFKRFRITPTPTESLEDLSAGASVLAEYALDAIQSAASDLDRAAAQQRDVVKRASDEIERLDLLRSDATFEGYLDGRTADDVRSLLAAHDT